MSDDEKLMDCILSSSSLSEVVEKITPLSVAGHSKSMFLLGCIGVILSTTDEERRKGCQLLETSEDPRVKSFKWILPYAQTAKYSWAFHNMCCTAIISDGYFLCASRSSETRGNKQDVE